MCMYAVCNTVFVSVLKDINDFMKQTQIHTHLHKRQRDKEIHSQK